MNGWKSFGTEDMENSLGGDDLGYWPKGVTSYRLMEKSKKNPNIQPHRKVLRAICCRIKRSNVTRYSEAFRELQIMEMNSDTDEFGRMKKLRKETPVAALFKHIQYSNPGPSFKSTLISPRSNQGDKVSESHNFSLATSRGKTKKDMRSNSPSVLRPRISGKQFFSSGEASSPDHSVVDGLETEKSDIHELLMSLQGKIDHNARMIQECKLVGNRNIALLCQVNAKLDVFVTQMNMKLDNIVSPEVQQPSSMDTSVPLIPIKSVEEMESIERKVNNKQFIIAVVKYFGSIHGKDRYVGEGRTVCLQIVDYSFDREFLLKCSWTGISRHTKGGEMNEPKIPFYKFDEVISLFHKVVIFSDPSHSLVESQKFLKRCLRNAKQRFEETKGIRTSVARKRSKPHVNQSTLRNMDGKYENQDEDEEPFVECKEPLLNGDVFEEDETEELVEYSEPDDINVSETKDIIIVEYLLE